MDCFARRLQVQERLTQQIAAEPALVLDGVVYISSWNGYVLAYPEDCERDCEPIWQTSEAGWGYTYVAVGAGKVFAGSDGPGLGATFGFDLPLAAQALEFLKPLKPGMGVLRAYQIVRQQVAPLDHDRELSSDIRTLTDIVHAGELARIHLEMPPA